MSFNSEAELQNLKELRGNLDSIDIKDIEPEEQRAFIKRRNKLAAEISRIENEKLQGVTSDRD